MQSLVTKQVEHFLAYLEENEKYVFEFCLDESIYPIIPFYQLIYISNIQEVIKVLIRMDEKFKSRLIRIDGYLTVVMDEQNYQAMEFKYHVVQLLKMMRF
ncbi:hypothetical protein AM461_07980 [Providencia rettgeri]|nr:hypothetical protein AM461_07980 [Providencia rettgeri]